MNFSTVAYTIGVVELPNTSFLQPAISAQTSSENFG